MWRLERAILLSSIREVDIGARDSIQRDIVRTYSIKTKGTANNGCPLFRLKSDPRKGLYFAL
jgi:hypothetical protein